MIALLSKSSVPSSKFKDGAEAGLSTRCLEGELTPAKNIPKTKPTLIKRKKQTDIRVFVLPYNRILFAEYTSTYGLWESNGKAFRLINLLYNCVSQKP